MSIGIVTREDEGYLKEISKHTPSAISGSAVVRRYPEDARRVERARERYHALRVADSPQLKEKINSWPAFQCFIKEEITGGPDPETSSSGPRTELHLPPSNHITRAK